ncbi:response regulator [Pseudoxanthomonas sacheonensis]|uniref:response regulator n=1 Tax=Pseudoxanthomonas sacheonensis TaxID=443615 RepID=UPI0013D22A14|nr:response regulator transcription factor [Pseudoxanthomonas sacheonensis]KAF1710755.1 DNA-binding response regulator [Pseudoxanthomonas sacheonensis]
MPATGPSSASPNAEQRILIVDDDADIVTLLTRYLSGHGFQVSGAGNGAELRAHVEGVGTDVILLDLGLPDEDGLELLRYLQGTWSGPVIVVSGRGEPVERVVGLELGADDFVSKPFDLRELLARIRSVLRRSAKTAPTQTPAPTAQSNLFEFAGFRLDLASRRLTDPQGDEVALTTGDFQLLCALLDKPRQVLSRDELMDALYKREAGPFDRAVDMGIGRLRRKIEPNPEVPILIKSVRGVGYLFASEVIRS